MTTQELLRDWYSGKIDIKAVATASREKMQNAGMVNIRPLGWIHANELQRLVSSGVIKKLENENGVFPNVDYGYRFTTESFSKFEKGARRGEQVEKHGIKLTQAASDYLFPSAKEKAIRANVASQQAWDSNLDF